jgi:hypothetical protein
MYDLGKKSSVTDRWQDVVEENPVQKLKLLDLQSKLR